MRPYMILMAFAALAALAFILLMVGCTDYGVKTKDYANSVSKFCADNGNPRIIEAKCISSAGDFCLERVIVDDPCSKYRVIK